MILANDLINTGSDLLDYWIKVTLLFTICYLVYKIWIDKTAYDFNFKRWVLLGMGINAILFPLFSIGMFPKYLKINNSEEITAAAIFPETSVSIDYMQLITVILIIGFALSISNMIYKIIGLYMMIQGQECLKMGKYVILKSKGNLESSFLNYIFTSNDNVNCLQIEHEKVHADQYHSLDILLAELLQSVLWFYPIVYQYKRDIKINHEYICDQSMIAKHGLATYADVILEQHRLIHANSLVNHFNSFIKNRIAMMNHLKNSGNTKTNYTLVSMFFIAVFCAFSFKTYIVPVNSQGSVIITQQDSLPAMDTIITLDPVTFVETVQIVQRKPQSSDSNVELDQLLKLYPEVVTYNDTTVLLDPKTYVEKVTITTCKMVKAYRIMIDNELRKSNPDMDKVNQWMEAGKRN